MRGAVIFCAFEREKVDEKRDGKEPKDHADDLPADFDLCSVDLDAKDREDGECVGGSRVSSVANACKL